MCSDQSWLFYYSPREVLDASYIIVADYPYLDSWNLYN